jgi:hypothetical protein
LVLTNPLSPSSFHLTLATNDDDTLNHYYAMQGAPVEIISVQLPFAAVDVKTETQEEVDAKLERKKENAQVSFIQ